VTGADLALLLLILAGVALRGGGMVVAGRLRPDHPAVRWAASVALATLAAFVFASVFAPTGALAGIPFAARLAGLAAALAVLAWRGGLLTPLLGGLCVTLALTAAL